MEQDQREQDQYPAGGWADAAAARGKVAVEGAKAAKAQEQEVLKGQAERVEKAQGEDRKRLQDLDNGKT